VEWLDKMNDAINYIEAHIEEKINYLTVAEIACCSLSRFQRMFSFVTDITLAEYVRCRRMALAANDLLSSDIKNTIMTPRRRSHGHFSLFTVFLLQLLESWGYIPNINAFHFKLELMEGILTWI
jgi:AraC-like DNA-binding protein